MASSNLRVVTLNFWGTEAPLDRRIALAIKQLAELEPDVVCMQEVKPHGAERPHTPLPTRSACTRTTRARRRGMPASAAWRPPVKRDSTC